MNRYLCLILGFILTTQLGCAIVNTAIGSFVGNSVAEMVHEEFKDNKNDREKK
jgi:hypothetical protein